VHAASRQLTREEYAKVRPAVERAVLERRTAGQLERDLRDAVAGTPLTNDMERVARTELRDAHAEGAYQTLKAETERLGLESRIAGAMVHRQANPSEWHEGGKLRTALEGICKEWCRCISRDFGHPDGIYWPELVQCLMEYPRERARIMESAVEFLRKQVKGENMNNQLLGEEK
jgi:hypothetical protein